MNIETKINVGIFLAILLIVLLTMGTTKASPTFDLDIDELIDSPSFGLTIQSGDPCDQDLEAVSCADAAAIVKYRKAINRIEAEKLREEIQVLERQVLEDEYGLREC